MNIKYIIIASLTILSHSVMYAAGASPESKTATPAIVSTKVRLPSAEILHERLQNLHCDHFARVTFIHEELGDHELLALDAAMIIEKMVNSYQKQLDSLTKSIIEWNKSDIITAILQDSPTVLAELKKMKLI